jgi:hypothetical protein
MSNINSMANPSSSLHLKGSSIVHAVASNSDTSNRNSTNHMGVAKHSSNDQKCNADRISIIKSSSNDTVSNN